MTVAEIEALQNRLAVLTAAYDQEGIPDQAWALATQRWYESGTVHPAPSRSNIQAEISTGIRLVLVTSSHWPNEAEIAGAQDIALRWERHLEAWRSFLPREVQRSSELSALEMEARVEAITPMKSPAEAGYAEFEKSIKERLELFGTLGLGKFKLGLFVVGALVAVALAMLTYSYFLGSLTRAERAGAGR